MKKQINIAVLGNTEVGKTTLLSALTAYAAQKGFGELIDPLDIDDTSIKKDDVVVSFAKVDVEADKTYSFYEFDTTADFYKGVLSGAVRIDAVLHVYDSECAFLPFQRDALRFMKRVGIDTIFGCCNLMGFVDEEFLELIDMEYEGTLEDLEFEDCAEYHFAINCSDAAMEFEDDLNRVELLFDCIAENARVTETMDGPSAVVTDFDAEIYMFSHSEFGNSRPIMSPVSIHFVGEDACYTCSFDCEDLITPSSQMNLTFTLDEPRRIKVGDVFFIDNRGKIAAIARVTELK